MNCPVFVSDTISAKIKLRMKLSETTMICRNKTPPTGAGIRPFLSGLYYYPGKNFVLLSKQLLVILFMKYLTEKLYRKCLLQLKLLGTFLVFTLI